MSYQVEIMEMSCQLVISCFKLFRKLSQTVSQMVMSVDKLK